MARVKALSEIFSEISKIKIKAERIQALRNAQLEMLKHVAPNESTLLKNVILCAYHPRVIWLLPRGIPPFRTNNVPNSETALYRESKHLQDFCFTGPRTNMSQDNRESMWINFLQDLFYEDAILMCNVKDKMINYPYLTYSLMREAFPDWLPPKTWLTEKERSETNEDNVVLDLRK